jgi:hypothetical protein
VNVAGALQHGICHGEVAMRRLSRTTAFAFLLSVLLPAAACGSLLAVSPTPLPTPIPTAVPTPTPNTPTPTSAPAPAYVDLNMPGCNGFQELPGTVSFDWPGLADIKDVDSWGYYRCTEPAGQLAALYKERMVTPPYNWQEISWVELPQGTLGAYFHAARQSWLYLWFLTNPDVPGTVLVAAPRLGDMPLDLPCCH